PTIYTLYLHDALPILTAIKKLMFEELEISKTLVVGPKRVVESVWDAECEKWEHLKDLRVSKIIGTAKQRKEALRKNADVYLVSRDRKSTRLNSSHVKI